MQTKATLDAQVAVPGEREVLINPGAAIGVGRMPQSNDSRCIMPSLQQIGISLSVLEHVINKKVWGEKTHLAKGC